MPPAIGRLVHHLERHPAPLAHAEHVHVAVAVGADSAAVGLAVDAVIGRRADLLLHPGAAAVGGPCDYQRGREGLAGAVPAVTPPSHVNLAAEGPARPVFDPDPPPV